MKKLFTRTTLSMIVLFAFIGTGLAQTTISGNVKDAENDEELAGINIVIQGTVTGTITDISGNFNLSTATVPPYKGKSMW